MTTRAYARPYDDPDEPELRDYHDLESAAEAPRWPGRALLILIGFVLGLFCGVELATAADQCVTIQVRPLVMVTESDIDVQTRVLRHEHHRLLEVAWTSDACSQGSSRTALEGARSRTWHQFWLRQQPAATYEFEATIFDATGGVTSHDRARILGPAPDSE